MKLEWLFGSSMDAHHLLWAYVSVWVIQGGYAVWIALQWKQTRKHARPAVTVDSVTHEDS